MEPSKSNPLKSFAGNWRIPHWGWGLLATVVLVVVGTGLRFGIPVYRQQQAIREIEALGVGVGTVKGGPVWLRKQVGDEWMKVFDDVESIPLYNNTNVTDGSLVHLKSLTKVIWLSLDNTQVTDAGLVHLKSLTKLEWLFLSNTQVTDAGLVHLKSLTNLKSLYLNSTPITDAGLEHLKSLTNLDFLNLDSTAVTDAGLVHLKSLTNLESLDLNGTQVTDAGLEHLKSLTNLKSLHLGNIQLFTRACIAELKRALPKLTVSHRRRPTPQ